MRQRDSRLNMEGSIIFILSFTKLFRRMFKKKVKKREDDEDEKKGGLSKKDLEDWAQLQQTLKKEKKDEDEPTGPKAYGDIKQGYNYLFEEYRPINAYKRFFSMLEQEKKGLCITHTYPQKIRDMHKAGFEDIPIFWLSDWYGASQEFLNIGTEESTMRPTRLDFEIMKEISNFIKKNRGRGVMLLDGVEALVLANNFEKVISFLTNVNNMASANQCTVLAPINPHVFRRRDRFILQKIFDEVRTFVDEGMGEEED